MDIRRPIQRLVDATRRFDSPRSRTSHTRSTITGPHDVDQTRHPGLAWSGQRTRVGSRRGRFPDSPALRRRRRGRNRNRPLSSGDDRIVCDEISENEQLATKTLGKQYGAIFAAHRQMVQDPKLVDEIIKLIRERHFSPEFASSRVLRRYAKMFQNLGNRYLADRADDIFDLGKADPPASARRAPRGTDAIDRCRWCAGAQSHAGRDGDAAQGIRARVRHRSRRPHEPHGHPRGSPGDSGRRRSRRTSSPMSPAGETVIIDGTRGEIIIDPDEETLGQYRDSQAAAQDGLRDDSKSLRQQPSDTRDHVRILLLGNIEFPEEVEHCTQRGADGIGLYRTEFLYLQSGREPTEEDHFDAYRRVVSAFPTATRS